jgi:hypothetical protein
MRWGYWMRRRAFLPLKGCQKGATGDGYWCAGHLLWFVNNQDILDQGIAAVTQRKGLRFLWIAWPKKGSPQHAGLTQPAVRQAGLSNGWVDYKICSIDADWSALLFARRK